jgi:transcription antitermination factor NusG
MKQVVQVHSERRELVLFVLLKLMMKQEDWHYVKNFHDVFENFEHNDDANFD